VFAIWEPILPTDWSKPNAAALQRLSDSRVRQYWDPNHLLSGVLKKAEARGKLHQECCERNNFLWDLVAAYSRGGEWRETLPEPILLNGPVVKRTAELDSILTLAK
jgi:hypothetical protein